MQGQTRSECLQSALKFLHVGEEVGRQGALSTAMKRNGHHSSTAHRRLPRLTQKKERTHFQIKKFHVIEYALSMGSGKGAHEMLSPRQLLLCY